MSYLSCVCSTEQLNELNMHLNIHKVMSDAANFNSVKTIPGAVQGLLYNFKVTVGNISSYHYFSTRL